MRGWVYVCVCVLVFWLLYKGVVFFILENTSRFEIDFEY